jgi:hypothetical protein
LSITILALGQWCVVTSYDGSAGCGRRDVRRQLLQLAPIRGAAAITTF